MTAVPTATSLFPPGAAERQGLRAGVVTRTGAMLVDTVAVALITGAAYGTSAAVRFMRRSVGFHWPRPSSAETILLAGAIAVAYLSVRWSSTGRTAGHRLFGLRVVRPGGARLHYPRAFLRALTCVAFPLGLFWCAVSRRNASIHDLVFGTSVIYDWENRVPVALTDAESSGRESSGDPLGAGVDVAATVADEPHDGHPEPRSRLDGE